MRALWAPWVDSQDSFVFHLRPFQFAYIFATRFEKYKTRASAQELETRQYACLHKVLFEFSCDCTPPFAPAYENCDCIFDVSKVAPTVVEDEVVWIDGCMWRVSQKDNYKILDFPGFYYFHLNDATAVGEAQIYIEIFNKHHKPPTVRPTLRSLV